MEENFSFILRTSSSRRRDRDRMVVGFTISAITTKVVSSNPVHGEVYSV